MVCIGTLKYDIVGNQLGSQMDICMIPSFTIVDDGGRLIFMTCLFLFLFLSPKVIDEVGRISRD